MPLLILGIWFIDIFLVAGFIIALGLLMILVNAIIAMIRVIIEARSERVRIRQYKAYW